MSMKKKDFFFLSLLGLTLILVFPDLFSLKSAFLCGDHREQQYPWAFFLQSQIREFRFPWWTHSIQAGFPLLAEGQIGAFYPINLIFLFLLPIKWAYNYGILFHYALGVFLFYAYLRSLKLSEAASFFASLIFLYGSSQGGYFYYNYICQKVVIWLPLSLLLIDRLNEKPSFKDAYWLAVVFALEIFGGYLQVAIYTIFFSILYFIFRWIPKRSPKSAGLFTLAGLLGIFFSLAQILPTFELAQFSSRADAAREVAFIGSMNPLGLLTLIYPSWDGFLGSELYVGLLGLFFAALGLKYPKNSHRNFFILSTFLFLLLALGKWSPLYRGLIDLTHFHSFRTPIKFLFYVGFSLAVLAAFGFDYFFRILEIPCAQLKQIRLFRWVSYLFFAMLVIPSLSSFLLNHYESRLKPKFVSYVEEQFYGKPGHPHSREEYRKKAQDFYQSIQDIISLKTRDTRNEFILLSLTILVILLVSRIPLSKRTLLILFSSWLFFDLYIYGFTSIQATLEPFDSIPPPLPQNSITQTLSHEKSPFRIIENISSDSTSVRYPILPSSNMLYGIDDLGAYSPLIMKKIRHALGGWGGYFNDSFQTEWMVADRMLGHLEDLKRLNVKFILSHKPLKSPELLLRAKESSFLLYEIQGAIQPRAFFLSADQLPKRISDLSNDRIQPVTITDLDHGRMRFETHPSSKGYLLVSEVAYPGWRAWVDKKSSMIQSWGGDLFQGVALEPGIHSIEMKYNPVLFKRISLCSLAVALFLLILCLKQPQKKVACG